jgi:hypothetical protein
LKVGNLVTYLESLYHAGEKNGRFSILLLGKPGIGKSTSIKAAARRIAKSLKREFIQYDDTLYDKIMQEPDRYYVFVDFRLTECEPTDLLGIPEKVNGGVKFCPLLWALVLSKVPGLLLLDELTNVQRPDVISISYKLIFDLKAGFVAFNPGIMIVAAGNRPEESSVANMLPTPLISRMLIIQVDQPTVQEWADWMNDNFFGEWDTRNLAFLRRFETDGYLLQIPSKTETLDAYAVPRTWTALSLLMKQGIDDDETIVGLVGYEVGQKLEAFLKVNVDMDDLLDHPSKFRELNLDGKYMVSVMLSSWITKNIKKPQKSFELIDWMSNESKEFLILTCIGMQKPQLVNFLKELFIGRPQYKEILSEIVIRLKEEIQR